MNEGTITREVWLQRCVARLMERAGLGRDDAMLLAESQLENLKDDLSENPEDAADDELSYWTAD